MKFRLLLPTIFLLIAMLFVAVNIVRAGHGPNTFDFVLYCAYPAAYLTDLLGSFFGGPALVSFLLGMGAGSLQYFVGGYFIDKLLQRHKRVETV